VTHPSIASNWWGTVDVAAIGKSIFDGHDDKDYATVSFEPVLEKAVLEPTPRVAITSWKIEYDTVDEAMPVYLTLYNPGTAREVELLLMIVYEDRAWAVVQGVVAYPGASTDSSGWHRFSLPADSVYFTTLIDPKYQGAAGLRSGYFLATLFDQLTGERIGDPALARFELARGGTP
jgi:hypothetical protein